MYLKNIEVHGFKSFCNKVLFEFHDGITGIVGPNGSGKSNVADAVRWVLGEQSAKQLRGSKMEDVIFSGTENRKAMGYAYVAITLDNSDHKLSVDYEEVTIARRVYRSGESEYLINGTPCRLRDVQELFLDTGIGKEGYSIIGQGQVEKILSGKPEERRELFDEAAGIVKFKKRKQLAEKNLMQERENLTRINDILSEQERQLGPLLEQAKTARTYLGYREQQKQLDVSLFLINYHSYDKDKREKEEKLGIIAEDIEKVEKEKEKNDADYEALINNSDKMDEKIQAVNEEIQNTGVAVKEKEGNCEVLKAKIEGEEKSCETYSQRSIQLDEEIKDKRKTKEGYEKELSMLSVSGGQLEMTYQIFEEKQKAYEEKIQELRDERKQANQELMDILEQDSDFKVKLERFQTLLEERSNAKADISRRVLENKSREAAFHEDIKAKEEEWSIQKEKVDEAQKIWDTLNDEIELLNEQIHNTQNLEIKTQKEGIHYEERYKYLKNMVERYEGFGSVIQKIMEQKERIDGIEGVVSDLIKVDKEYETAIETVLGGNIRNIVTKNDTAAKQLIGFLKRNRYGRATFLPMTSVKGRPYKHPEALKESGVVGLGNTLVKTSKQYEGIVDYLLGQVLVVEKIDQALAIEKKFGHSLRIVTLEGELLNPGGSMTGGAYKNTSSHLSRNRELSELTEAVKESRKNVKELSKELTSLKGEKEKKSRIRDKHQKTLEHLKLGEKEISIMLEQMKNNLSELKDQYEEIEKEREFNALKEKEYNNEIYRLENGNSKFKEKSEELGRVVERCNRELEKLLKEEEENRKELTASQLELNSFKQNVSHIQENLDRVSVEIEKGEEEKERQAVLISEAKDSIENELARIESLKNEIEEDSKRETSLKEALKGLYKEKQDLSKEQNSLHKMTQDIAERLQSLEREKDRLENFISQLQEQKDRDISHMWEEYELTPTECEKLPVLELSKDKLKKESEAVRQKIRSLGEVNVGAIESYQELSVRYEDLKKQHDDLIEAEKVLIDTIEELDESMRKQFTEKFGLIKEQFQGVFKELFGGGKADLLLVQDEDILEAGISINAQPPGKKLQNMMMLSGGEKALTAIALLFAIQNLKPSPFCLLDEIEAALDDSNVIRYAKYLHKLTQHTQFIVITHRHGTMEAADRLYGITMQEKGVSALVSIDLVEAELEKEEKNGNI